jgi:hypothetical protein
LIPVKDAQQYPVISWFDFHHANEKNPKKQGDDHPGVNENQHVLACFFAAKNNDEIWLKNLVHTCVTHTIWVLVCLPWLGIVLLEYCFRYVHQLQTPTYLSSPIM